MWLYGARLAPVSITRYGAGHRSRVIGCQQPGAPRATASVHPRQILRIGIGIGRAANDSG